MVLPNNFKLIYSRDEIAARVVAMAEEIEGRLRDAEGDVVTVPIMRGALFFYADLVRAINLPLILSPATVSSYESSANNQHKVGVTISMNNQEIAGREVLLVDDITDTGRTFYEMERHCLHHGAKRIYSAALIRRAVAKPQSTPTWNGFTYDGPEWFVGYGMEDCNRFRNLPDVYVIRQ